jgi:SAM-dependent methyltransferase
VVWLGFLVVATASVMNLLDSTIMQTAAPAIRREPGRSYADHLARERLSAEGLHGSFVIGDAHTLLFEDGAFDVVLSVFGVIFAPNAHRALSELLRVLAPDGRALISTWISGGAIDAMVNVITGAISAALGADIPRFPWHDPTVVGELAAELGVSLRVRDGVFVFSAGSPESYLTDQETHHPLTIAAKALLQNTGSYHAARTQMLDALRHGNEDQRHFRATSRYRVIQLRRADP